jgi:hypothetical protein
MPCFFTPKALTKEELNYQAAGCSFERHRKRYFEFLLNEQKTYIIPRFL